MLHFILKIATLIIIVQGIYFWRHDKYVLREVYTSL